MELSKFSELNKLRSIKAFNMPVEGNDMHFMVATVQSLQSLAKALASKKPNESVGESIADMVIYLDLLAQSFGIDLELELLTKFNRTSVKKGFDEMLTQ